MSPPEKVKQHLMLHKIFKKVKKNPLFFTIITIKVCNKGKNNLMTTDLFNQIHHHDNTNDNIIYVLHAASRRRCRVVYYHS